MMFLVLALAFLVTVYGQAPDPTKVCLPDVLQVESTSLIKNATGVYAYNFPNNTIAARFNIGTRLVLNLTTRTAYYFLLSSCYWSNISSWETVNNGLVSQCLPAGAKLTPANTHLGLSPASLDIQAWEIDGGKLGSARVALTNSSPAVPVFTQSLFNRPSTPGAGPETGDVMVLVNAKTSIDDYTIFDVPDECQENLSG